ncbi:hypothetical protein ACP_0854 [Acidobacterium capsulatum ATCC 51196]|uniref:Uncharacterized protein n=1 Tax=Acidobacterium capsulatum (strain ATCC 51196 / DSM 11244 / BCRC 80197 / JCM 7670 / NBRC 15755 / NCIMB 13165 / 161) TaxID=240015 RepID=C1F2V3_ACIC5|nr:hypothetical protein ACP_0854 [Acidobacterium capsulatum ATCC 51196]
MIPTRTTIRYTFIFPNLLEWNSAAFPFYYDC